MKYLKKTCVVTLSAAMILSMTPGVGKISYAAGEVEKEETVYINQKADGTVDNITVSDWLKNITGTGDISDVSNLKDIKNVKGDESFEQGSDGRLTWKADNKDIYYQGTTDEELPVGVKISYELDGAAISPSDMAGKSGKVTITIKYENDATYEDEINGKNTTLNTPFLMASAVILPVDNFSNVTVSQGKIVSEGSNQILLAYGMPGLSESLNLSDDLKDEMNKKLSDTVTITADVKDFSLGSIYTVAAADEFSDVDLDDESDINDVENAINDLADATDELIAGSEQLSDGLTSLQNNFKTYANGVDDVSEGAGDLSDGAGKLSKGVSKYTSGVKKVTNGASQFVTGTQSLVAGVNEYVAGEQLIDAGTAELYNSTKAFPSQYSKFSEGLLNYISGVNQIANVENTKKLANGSRAVSNGIASVNSGLNELESSYSNYESALAALESIDASTLQAEDQAKLAGAIQGLRQVIDAQRTAVGTLEAATDNSSDLAAGAKTIADTMAVLNERSPELAAGGEELKTYNAQIKDGISDVAGGISSLYDGVKKLSENNETLLTGAATLNSSGIDLTTGIGQLSDSTKTLTSSAKKLSKGANKLSKGAAKLDNATKDVSDGVDKLQGGSVDLFDGLNQFKSEGTGKLQNEYNNNIKTVIERFQSLTDGADEYKTFSGIADGMDGKVKFIFQTAEISSEKE